METYELRAFFRMYAFDMQFHCSFILEKTIAMRALNINAHLSHRSLSELVRVVDAWHRRVQVPSLTINSFLFFTFHGNDSFVASIFFKRFSRPAQINYNLLAFLCGLEERRTVVAFAFIPGSCDLQSADVSSCDVEQIIDRRELRQARILKVVCFQKDFELNIVRFSLVFGLALVFAC